MTKEEVSEQIQNDLISCLDSLPDKLISDVCQIVVDNMKKLEDGK